MGRTENACLRAPKRVKEKEGVPRKDGWPRERERIRARERRPPGLRRERERVPLQARRGEGQGAGLGVRAIRFERLVESENGSLFKHVAVRDREQDSAYVPSASNVAPRSKAWTKTESNTHKAHKKIEALEALK